MSDFTIIKAPLQPLSVEQAVRRVREVSTLPQVAMRMLAMGNDMAMGAAELSRLVESDPPLTVRVIRCVNSASYGLRTRLNSVQRAVAYLGFKTVRNLAIAASVAEVFRAKSTIGPYTREGLWRHVVSVAIASRMIAMRAGVTDFEEAFLAGLLHDVGIILEDQYMHPHFVAIMERVEPGAKLCDLELGILGLDHAVLGARVAEQWRFPEGTIAAIRYHHQPQLHTGPHASLIATVALANLLCSTKGRSSVGMNLLDLPAAVVETLRLEPAGIQVIHDDLDREFEQQNELFKLVG